MTRARQRVGRVRAESALAALDTQVMAIEAQLSARGESDVSDRLVRVEQLRERARGLAAVLVERRRSLERDKGQLLDAGVVANLEADAARFREELDAVVVALAAIEPASSSWSPTRRRSAANVRRCSTRSPPMPPAHRPRAQLPRSAASCAPSAHRTSAPWVTCGDSATGSTRSPNGAMRALDDEVAIPRRVRGGRLGRGAAGRRAAAGRSRPSRSRVGVTRHASRCAPMPPTPASTWTARVEALQMALDAARARAGAERLAGVDGVLGTLLDLIEIDEGWEPAVEAALGESLTAVVVDDPAAGRRALTALRSSDTSGAVLALGARPASSAPSSDRRCGAPTCASGRPGVSTLLDGLLGGAVRSTRCRRRGRRGVGASRGRRRDRRRRPVRAQRVASRRPPAAARPQRRSTMPSSSAAAAEAELALANDAARRRRTGAPVGAGRPKPN